MSCSLLKGRENELLLDVSQNVSLQVYILLIRQLSSSRACQMSNQISIYIYIYIYSQGVDDGIHYRPQRSCGQGNISHPSVILFTGGVCFSACWDTTPPEQTPRPQEQTPPPPRKQTPPGADTTTPPSPREADSSIRSTSGRYASYWNAFLFI